MFPHATNPDRGYASASPTRFRFKRKRREAAHDEPQRHNRDCTSQSRNQDRPINSSSYHDADPPKHHQRRRSSRHNKTYHRQHRHTEAQDSTIDDSPYNATPPLDSQAAFRESLFDALADDEGAAYWEGVYGQPIHIYPNVKGASIAGEDGEELGELERMTDEEYAAYVRARMFEKTHQHVIEERQRREEEKERRRADERERRTMRGKMSGDEAEYEDLRQRIEESLARGKERKIGVADREKWKRAWRRYREGWERLKMENGVVGSKEQSDEGDDEGEKRRKGKSKKHLRDVLPWPVQSGRWTDVSRQEIERFYCNAPPQAERGKNGDDALTTLLKGERVKWHPDKVQHRFGGGDAVDEKTMEWVTAVFQIIDGMRSEDRRAHD